MAYLDDLIQNHVVLRDQDELKWFNERFTGWLNLQPKADMIFGDQIVNFKVLQQSINMKNTMISGTLSTISKRNICEDF